MARKNRRVNHSETFDIERLSHGGAKLISKRGSSWYVREVPASRAEKIYTCPACGNEIPRGQAHVVAWREDHLFGSEHAVQERRHWHNYCWRVH